MADVFFTLRATLIAALEEGADALAVGALLVLGACAVVYPGHAAGGWVALA